MLSVCVGDREVFGSFDKHRQTFSHRFSDSEIQLQQLHSSCTQINSVEHDVIRTRSRDMIQKDNMYRCDKRYSSVHVLNKNSC